MAYITKSNSKRILKKINLNEIGKLEGKVYKRPIYFFSKWEEKNLLLMKSLLKEPEKFAIEMYKPIVNKDSFRYVYESEQPPSYHLDIKCERMISKFKNFEVPFEIKARVRERAISEGKSEMEAENLEKRQVEVFRDWFKNNINLFNNDLESFLKKLDIRWNIKRTVKEIEYGNSGVEYLENLNLEELEQKIDKILEEASKFFKDSDKSKQKIICLFQKKTILANNKDKIYSNNTVLNDKELKRFLREYYDKFKKPAEELLIQYYRVKYNPDLSFEGKLLERLNFRPCSACK